MKEKNDTPKKELDIEGLKKSVEEFREVRKISRTAKKALKNHITALKECKEISSHLSNKLEGKNERDI